MSSGMICVPQWTCYINSHVFGAVKSKDSCMCLLTENLKKMSLIDEDKSHNIMAPDEENPLVSTRPLILPGSYDQRYKRFTGCRASVLFRPPNES